MFVHYFEPHVPYAPPPPYATLFDTGYAGPLPDKAIGDVLAGLRARHLTERTLVVLFADHGEEFFEHGGFEHGHSLHGEVVRVPLIVAFPGTIEGNRRLPDQVRLLDVMPTVLDLVGIQPPEHLEGASLKPLLAGDGGPAARGDDLLPPGVAYSESLIRGRQTKSIVRDGWKLIYDAFTERAELYNIAEDPGEQREVAEREPEVRSALEEILFTALFGLSDTWYIEMAGGESAHVFDVAVTPERGLSRGGIPLYRVRDCKGHMVALGTKVDKSEHALQLGDLEVSAPVGLAFKVDPEDFPVTFDLRLDGKPATPHTYLGHALVPAETMPFEQRPRRAGKRSAGEPTQRPAPPYILVWRWESPYQGEATATLDEATKKQLRALGYV